MILTQLKVQMPTISVIFLLLAFGQQANASTLHEVNVVAVAVDDQSASARRSALNAAFRQVVLKMSGDRTKYNSRLLRNYAANEYLKAYQYEMNNSQLEYVATFDTAKLQQLLRLLALPIWEARRPDSILWLSVDVKDAQNDDILSESEETQLTEVIDTTSLQRGIDIVLPLMDIEDRTAVTGYDVEGRFMTPVLLASQRYAINHVIVARVRNTPEYNAEELEQRIKALQENALLPEDLPLTPSVPSDIELNTLMEQETQETEPLFSIEEFREILSTLQPYQLDFTFHIDGVFKSGTLAGESPERLLAEMLDRYVDNLSQRYAVQLGQTNELQMITMQVNNINSLQNYTEVMQFLSTLTLIDSVILVEQSGTVAQFKVSLLTDRERLIDTLLLDGRLMPIVNDFGEVIDDSQFYWN